MSYVVSVQFGSILFVLSQTQTMQNIGVAKMNKDNCHQKYVYNAVCGIM